MSPIKFSYISIKKSRVYLQILSGFSFFPCSIIEIFLFSSVSNYYLSIQLSRKLFSYLINLKMNFKAGPAKQYSMGINSFFFSNSG